MSALVLPWFRMYTDFLSDSKVVALEFEDQRHFICVLALKSAGVLDQDCDPKLMDRIVAQRLWVNPEDIHGVKERLVSAQLIDSNWQPLAWEKRQRHSDHDPTGAERQRRFREKKMRNALDNAAVTGKDKDKDKDKEEDKEEEEEERRRKRSLSVKDLIAEGVNAQHAEDWMILRDSKRLPLTLTAWRAVKTQAEKAGMTPAQAVEIAAAAGWAGFKADWLNPRQESKSGGTAWWLSPEAALAKANEVGVSAARPGESEAAWHSRIRAAIDSSDRPSNLAAIEAALPKDSGAPANLKAVISLSNREALRKATQLLRSNECGKSFRSTVSD